MLRLILGRLLSLGLTLAVVSGAIFVVLDVLPGDPAAVMLGTAATPETLQALRLDLGLDRPAPERYLAWAGGLLTGDLGTSLTYKTPVAGLVAERMTVTLPLAGLALLLALAVSIPAGILAASRRGGAADRIVGIASQVGVAVPNFWVGLLLILLFSTRLNWLPPGGFPGWSAGLGPALAALVLPAAALALPQAAVLARITRSAALDVIGQDFVRTARSKGVREARVLSRHVLPNAMVPVATVLGLQLSFLIAGAVLVENVFNLPGLGRLAYQALAQRDLVTIRSVVMILSGIVVVVNAVVDIAYLLLDPRLRARS